MRIILSSPPSFYKSLWLFSLLLVVHSATTDLVVDCSITTATGTTYPTLILAINALYQGSNLKTTTNIITLLPTCVGKTQILTRTIVGSNSETIAIKYQNSPASITDSSMCSQLPTLSLAGSTSWLNTQKLSAFSLTGLSIQYQWKSTNAHSQYSIGTFTLSSVCLDLTDSLTSAPTNYYWFYIYWTTNVVISNSYISHDGSKNIYFDYVTNATVSNVKIRFTNFLYDSTIPVIGVYQGGSYYDTTLTVSNVEIICSSSSAMAMPKAILVQQSTAAYYTNISVSNCDFSGYTTVSQSFFYAGASLTSVFNNISFKNITFGNYPSQRLMHVTGMRNSTISNVQATSITTKNLLTIFYFISISNVASTYYPPGIFAVISNISVTNSSLGNYNYLLSYNLLGPKFLAGLQADAFTVSNTIMGESSSIIKGEMTPVTTNTTELTPIRPTFTNFNVVNCNFTFGYIMSFENNDYGVKAIEPYHIEYYNCYFANNYINVTYVFQSEGALSRIVNMTAENNTLVDLSAFIVSNLKLNSLTVMNSTFTNFSISKSSALISNGALNANRYYNYGTAIRQFQIEITFKANNTFMYAETKPFILYNSKFSNIHVYDVSHVVWAANPQSIVQNCTFTNITQNNARLLQLGGYVIYAHTFTYFQYTQTQGYVYLPTTKNFDFFPAAENAVLSGNEITRALFYSARNQTALYDPSNCAHFVFAKGNTFQNITVYDSDYVVGLDDFNIPNASIAIFDNTFSGITGSCSVNFPIISSNSVNRAFIGGNTLYQVDILGYMFSLQSSLLDNFFFDSNTLSDSRKIAAYYFIADSCNNITVLNMQGLNLQTENDFISMTCALIKTQITLINSTFENISQTSSQGKSQAINFISIGTQNFSTTDVGNLLIQGNSFKNVSLSREIGYTTETAQTSFLSIFMTQSHAIMQNNSFNEIRLSDGNIMTVSVPTLTIQGSFYSNLYFGDAKGALNLISLSLTLKDTKFENSSSLNHAGAGLMKLTTPDPTNAILDVTVLGCSFSNNTASYGTVFYTASSQINFEMKDSNISDNLVSGNGGVFFFNNNTNSNITLENLTFMLNQHLLPTYPALYLFSLENTVNSNVNLSKSTLTLGGSLPGTFINANSNQGLKLTIEDFNLTALASATGTLSTDSSFRIVSADGIDGSFSGINVVNISLSQYPLFTINCNTKASSSSISQRWLVQITQCNFDNLKLDQPIIAINSDEYLQEPLNNFSLTIDSSVFSNISWINVGNGGGVIASNTKLIGNNQSSTDAPIFSVVIKNSNFSRLNGTQTSVVYYGQESLYSNILLLENNRFQSIQADCSGAIINPSSTLLTAYTTTTSSNGQDEVTIKLDTNYFSDITAQEGGILSWISTQKQIGVHFTNNSVNKVSVAQDGGAFYLNYPSTTNNESSKKVVINITNSSFSDITAQNGGILQAVGTSNLFEVSINSDKISNVAVSGNGAIVNLPKSDANIANTTSSSLRRRDLESVDSYSNLGEISFLNTNFSSISATNGGILYDFTTNQTVNISLINNTFNSIQASKRGGIAFANQPYLLLQNNSALETNAGVAGPVFYSNSDQLHLVDQQNLYQGVDPNTSFAFSPTNLKIEVFDLLSSTPLALENYDETLSTNPVLRNVTSYSMEQLELTFTLVYVGDFGVQTVKDESTNPIINLVFIPASKSLDEQVYLSPSCRNSICKVTASSIILEGNAGDEYLVNVTYQSSVYTQFQQFSLRLRECLPGELNQTATGRCVMCPQGKYSLSPSDLTCNDCPAGAECRGGGNIFIQKGYYRSQNTSSLLILSCDDNDGERCLGGLNNTCREGYTGPLCLQCDYENEYITDSKGNCGKCNTSESFYTLAIFYLIGGVLYQIYLVVCSFKRNKKRHTKLKRKVTVVKTDLQSLAESAEESGEEQLRPGDFLVIYSSYTQIFSIFATLGLGSISGVLDAPETVANPNRQVFESLKCLLYARTSSPLEELQLEILLYVFSPIVKFIAVLIFEIIRMIILRGREPKVKAAVRLGTVAIVLTLLEQPSIIGSLSNYLSCSKLDPYVDTKYVKLPNTVQCHTPEYNHFRNVAVIPAIIFWGLAVPLTIFLVLYKKRKALVKSENLCIVFGHLYSRYTEKAYYWGIFIIYFKMLLFTLDSILNLPTNAKLLIFLGLVQIYYELLVKRPPYKEKVLFDAERYCVHAYRLSLLVITFKFCYPDAKLSLACEIITLMVACAAGSFILIHVGKLYLDKIKEIIEKLKDAVRTKKLLKMTLRALREYHDQKDEIKFKKNRRRNGMIVERPYQ